MRVDHQEDDKIGRKVEVEDVVNHRQNSVEDKQDEQVELALEAKLHSVLTSLDVLVVHGHVVVFLISADVTVPDLAVTDLHLFARNEHLHLVHVGKRDSLGHDVVDLRDDLHCHIVLDHILDVVRPDENHRVREQTQSTAEQLEESEAHGVLESLAYKSCGILLDKAQHLLG